MSPSTKPGSLTSRCASPASSRRSSSTPPINTSGKGQPLFTIYSPDLVATEREYLVARQNHKQVAHSTIPGVASGAASLLDAAVERLKQWQVPDSEIDRLEKTGEVQQEIEIDSPVSGYITERKRVSEHRRTAGHAPLRHRRPLDGLGQRAGVSERPRAGQG